MVVMVIMGILVMVGLTSFKSTSQKGRDNKRKSDLRQVATALETYYSDKGQYPAADPGGTGKLMGCGAGAVEVCNWGDTFSNTTNNTLYMLNLPKDPTSSLQYYYNKVGNGYKLYARLENSQDPEYISAGYAGPTGFKCGASSVIVECTYAIASTNLTP